MLVLRRRCLTKNDVPRSKLNQSVVNTQFQSRNKFLEEKKAKFASPLAHQRTNGREREGERERERESEALTANTNNLK